MESTTAVSRNNLDGAIYRTHAINFANVNSSFRPVRGKAMAAKSGASRSCIFFLSLSSSNQLQNTMDQVPMFLFPHAKSNLSLHHEDELRKFSGFI